MNTNISVIIPTSYNYRALTNSGYQNKHKSLERCLSSIHSSSFHYKELIIVDSSEEIYIRDNIKKLAETFNGKYIYEPRKGVSIARNTGIKNADGDILVFADDDFVVDKNWIKCLLENYKDQKVVCCTGRMLSYREDYTSKLYEKSMSFDRGNRRRIFTRDDINILNLFKTATKIGDKRLLDKTPVPWAIGFGFYSFRKSIFADIGNFDTNLGRGTPSIGGEDPDIFYRIIKSGKTIVYEPRAIIYHDHREHYNDLLKDAHNSGISIKALTTKYVKERDIYMTFIFIGEFFLLCSALVKASFGSDNDFRKLVKEELKGFLNGQSYTIKTEC